MKMFYVFVFRRRLQDVFKTNMLVLTLHLQKTSWSRPIYSSWSYVFKTTSRRFQDVLPRRLQDVLQKRIQDDLKTSSRRLQDVLQRYFQDVFKTYHQVKLFLLTCLREVFNTFLRYFFPKTVIYRSICLGNTTSEKFMATVQNLKER